MEGVNDKHQLFFLYFETPCTEAEGYFLTRRQLWWPSRNNGDTSWRSQLRTHCLRTGAEIAEILPHASRPRHDRGTLRECVRGDVLATTSNPWCANQAMSRPLPAPSSRTAAWHAAVRSRGSHGAIQQSVSCGFMTWRSPLLGPARTQPVGGEASPLSDRSGLRRTVAWSSGDVCFWPEANYGRVNTRTLRTDSGCQRPFATQERTMA